jgi:hypothetical protein
MATVGSEFPTTYVILYPSTALPDSSKTWHLGTANRAEMSSRKACISATQSPLLITRVGSKAASCVANPRCRWPKPPAR